MKKKGLIYLFCLTILLAHSEPLQAFEVSVHRRITENVIDQNSAVFSSTLKNIGLSGSLTEVINNKEIRLWIEDGSMQEDEPIYGIRYFKHFYNPLATNSSAAGLNGMLLSSYQWAGDGGNEWSWRATRSKYYTGLTATTNTERRAALADSFRAIGQVMHLVQDMASPAHVRNDGHLVYDGFEAYTKKNIKNYSAYGFANALTSVSPYAPKQFWDSDTYDGSNPSASNTQGLAEYTNANFFSGDTVANGSFPYPKIYTGTTIDIRGFKNENTGITNPRMYYLKKYDGETNNGQGYLISTVAFLDDWRAREIPISTPDQPFFPVLDENVYKDYAFLLIPRAVGYSAGLLNYFFRGKVFMEKDPQNAGKYIIKNESNEKMEGTFALYYDDASGNRTPVSGASWTLTINPNSASSPVTFTEPTSPAPKEKGKYILVFQGKLGMEEGAVVGRVVSLEEDFFEDWEKGLTGRYPWKPARYYHTKEIINGYADNPSNVLQLQEGGLGMTLPNPVDVPAKISFDYYVKSIAVRPIIGVLLNDEDCFFEIDTIESSPVCDDDWAICWFPMEKGKWVHFEIPDSILKCSDWTSKISYVEIYVYGKDDVDGLTKVYIDNIVFYY